jgi:uncharacterized membrane protein
LVEEARHALREELATRGITPKDTAAYVAEINARIAAHNEYIGQRIRATERGYRVWRRFALVLFGVLFASGAWLLLVNKDSRGSGIMIACVVALPLALLIAHLRHALVQAGLRGQRRLTIVGGGRDE